MYIKCIATANRILELYAKCDFCTKNNLTLTFAAVRVRFYCNSDLHPTAIHTHGIPIFGIHISFLRILTVLKCTATTTCFELNTILFLIYKSKHEMNYLFFLLNEEKSFLF